MDTIRELATRQSGYYMVRLVPHSIGNDSFRDSFKRISSTQLPSGDVIMLQDPS